MTSGQDALFPFFPPRLAPPGRRLLGAAKGGRVYRGGRQKEGQLSMGSPRNAKADDEEKARRSRRPDQSRTRPRIGQDRREWRNGFGSIAGRALSPAGQEGIEREEKMGKEGGHVLKAARMGLLQGGPPRGSSDGQGGLEEAGNWGRGGEAKRLDGWMRRKPKADTGEQAMYVPSRRTVLERRTATEQATLCKWADEWTDPSGGRMPDGGCALTTGPAKRWDAVRCPSLQSPQGRWRWRLIGLPGRDRP